MSKHTPGPWTVRRSMPEDGYECWFISACPRPNQEVDIGDVAGGYPHEQNEANARLIASAPELLNMVQMIANIGQYRDLVDKMAMCLRAHERAGFEKMFREDAAALIAKATGGAA